MQFFRYKILLLGVVAAALLAAAPLHGRADEGEALSEENIAPEEYDDGLTEEERAAMEAEMEMGMPAIADDPEVAGQNDEPAEDVIEEAAPEEPAAENMMIEEPAAADGLPAETGLTAPTGDSAEKAPEETAEKAPAPRQNKRWWGRPY